MMNIKKRGLLASAGALATVAALALGGAAAVAATLPMPDKSGLVITKLEQPATAGGAATGEQAGTGSQPALTGTRIQGVEFKAYPVSVSGTPGSAAWQQNVASVTLSAAQTAVGTPNATVTAIRTGTTDVNGEISWTGASSTAGDLPQGLYLIRETDAPTNVVRSGDFLVALPMTNPTDKNAWLNTVYVYPKNAKVDANKTVKNADKFEVGNTVTWTIDTAIPDARNGSGTPVAPDAFEIHDTLTNAELSLAPAYVAGSNSGIRVKAGATTLVEGTDYNVAPDTSVAGKTTYKIVFTSAGRTALLTARTANPTNRVTVELDTKVLKVDVIDNAANIFPNQKSITDNKPLTTDPATVKYGKIELDKKSSDNTVTGAALAGAEFKVYLTETAAKAGGTDNVKPEVTSAGYNSSTGVWTTQSGGAVEISGLRYSDYADGANQNPFVNGVGTCTDLVNGPASANCVVNTKYQTYWLVETKALPGHQLAAEPVKFTINSNTSALTTKQEFINQKNTNGFVLPLTGGTGTLFLTIGGIAILAIVLLVARRRRSQDAAAE